MCFSPQVHAIFRHPNFKKLSAADVFCTFSLTNGFLATTACNFSTSNFKKCSESVSFFLRFDLETRFSPQRRAIFDIETSKKCPEPDMFCAFSLQMVLLATAACNFFDIETSKSAPNLTCFVHFHFKMRCSPQRHAIFRHQNSKKCSEPGAFCTFSLQNAFFATMACIWRGCIFFLLTLPHLLSADLTTLLCFSTVHLLSKFCKHRGCLSIYKRTAKIKQRLLI